MLVFVLFCVKDLAKFRERKQKNWCPICTLLSLVAVFKPVLLFFTQALETYCHLMLNPSWEANWHTTSGI